MGWKARLSALVRAPRLGLGLGSWPCLRGLECVSDLRLVFEGFEGADARVADQVQAVAVGDRRRVGPARIVEDGAAGLHREAGGRGAVELGGVDDVADRGQ